MRRFIVLIFASIAISYVQGGIGGLLGDGGLLGAGGGGLLGGGASKVVGGASGVTGGLTGKDGKLLDVGSLLGLTPDNDCIKLCPKPISDTSLKCVSTTSFAGYPVCYQQNTKKKWIFPCADTVKPPTKKPKAPKQKNDDGDD